MKRTLLIATMIFLVCGTYAQTFDRGSLKSAVYTTNALDTVSSGVTKYLIATPISGQYAYCQASVTLRNISGTTSATVTLEHGLDGTGGIKWTSYPIDSVLVFAAAGTKGVLWTGYRDKYIRLKVVGSGTQSTEIQAQYELSK